MAVEFQDKEEGPHTSPESNNLPDLTSEPTLTEERDSTVKTVSSQQLDKEPTGSSGDQPVVSPITIDMRNPILQHSPSNEQGPYIPKPLKMFTQSDCFTDPPRPSSVYGFKFKGNEKVKSILDSIPRSKVPDSCFSFDLILTKKKFDF